MPVAVEVDSGVTAEVVVDIVEDQLLIRDLLGDGLSTAEGITLRHRFASADPALRVWSQSPPDVAVMDIALPGMNGVAAAVQAKRRHPAMSILLLSSHSHPRLLERLPADVRGGWGYMLKDHVSIQGITTAVLQLHLTGLWPSAPEPGHDGRLDLTSRQRQLLTLIGEGMSNDAIAARLGISRKSVENQINRIYATLGLGEQDGETNRRVLASQIASTIIDIDP